jgi:hypothetical protein
MDTAPKTVSWWAVENTKRLRNDARPRLSQEALAERLPSWSRSVLANFESHRRPALTIEECFQLAVALNVSPTNLLLPPDADERVAVTLAVEVPGHWVRAWLYGEHPVPLDANHQDFIAKAPRHEQQERDERLWRHPADAAIQELRTYVRGAILGPTELVHPELMADALRRTVARLTDYIEVLARETEQKEAW